MSRKNLLEEKFFSYFGSSPRFWVRAPGRVNLIGEHTDYNDGFVLPMSIDRFVWIALSKRNDGQVVVASLDFQETASFSLLELQKGKCSYTKDHWIEYIKGMAWAMLEAGYNLQGWQGVLSGDVPIGAGLSSSAALEMASARAFASVSDISWDGSGMARLGQKAENEWIGVRCGIMDQMISACGKLDHALLIDCRSLECRPIPIPPDSSVVVLDTTTRRDLVDSAYNERRNQCEQAAHFFGVEKLRDVLHSEFLKKCQELQEPMRRRVRHVIMENERTLEAAAAMLRHDPVALGKCMNESHESLRDNFEVCNEALNTMVECARLQSSCYGARMTGAGFGGCAVALVARQAVREFAHAVSNCYKKKTHLSPLVYICSASNGAEIINL